MPKAPAWMKGNAVALGQWRIKARALRAAGLLRDTDLELLSQWCGVYADVVAARETLNAEGRYIESSRGHRMLHPAAREMRDRIDRLVRLSRKFGFTPGDRAGLGASEPADDEFARFVARKHGPHLGENG